MKTSEYKILFLHQSSKCQHSPVVARSRHGVLIFIHFPVLHCWYPHSNYALIVRCYLALRLWAETGNRNILLWYKRELYSMICVCIWRKLWLLLPWYLRLWVQQSLSHFPGNVLKRFLKERLFSSYVLWVCESWVYCITKYWSCPTALPVPPFNWVEQKSGTHAFEVQTSNFSTFKECLCAFYNILSSFN